MDSFPKLPLVQGKLLRFCRTRPSQRSPHGSQRLANTLQYGAIHGVLAYKCRNSCSAVALMRWPTGSSLGETSCSTTRKLSAAAIRKLTKRRPLDALRTASTSHWRPLFPALGADSRKTVADGRSSPRPRHLGESSRSPAMRQVGHDSPEPSLPALHV